MKNKTICVKFSCLVLLLFTLALVSGCSGSGSGSGSNLLSSLGDGSGSKSVLPPVSSPADDPGSGSGGDDSGDDIVSPIVTTHNPEPSSILLLSSGLIGLALAARKRQKNKQKS